MQPDLRSDETKFVDAEIKRAAARERARCDDAVRLWFNAHDAYHKASDAYNQRLALVRAEREQRDNWSMTTDKEYHELGAAQAAAFQADEALYQVLRTARTFERASAAAPRQASAMSAEADRIHVRLLAMGWLDHREDNCKTATEAAKLIRELSEESATRQAEGPNNAGAILVRLRYAILTATNDDLSEPGTEKRTRHIARIEAMHDAMEEIVSLCAAAGLTVLRYHRTRTGKDR